MIIASQKDKERVIDILHSAFEPIKKDNAINFVVKQDHKRSERIRLLMEYIVEDCFDFGEILLSDKKNACILIKYPHKEKITLQVLKRHLKLAFYCIGIKKLFKVLNRQATLKRHHVKEPHIHPVIMGATNEVKGMGFGVPAIKQLFEERAEANKLPVIIETTTEQNAKMYQRFGFKIFKEIQTRKFPIYFLRIN